MAKLIYETHRMEHPQLPFLYHPERTLVRRRGLPNWHKNIELLRCTGGQGGVLCGGTDYPLAPDEIFVINSDLPHCLYGGQEGLQFLCLIIDGSFFDANGLDARTLYFQPVIRDPEALELFDRAAEAYERFDPDRLCAVADIRWSVLGLVRHLCAHHLTQPPRNPARSDTAFVMEAVAYIRSNFDRSISLDDVAEHVGVSKYHLSRHFRTYTGQTVVQALNLTRCTRAEQLIREGRSVSAAAAACGFDNLSYFSRTYKRLMGKLPSAARST